MAHYAFINTDSEVVEVITGKDEDDLDTLPEGFDSWEEYYETQREGLTCKRTSYNTQSNEHLDGGTPFRANYAGIGFIYDDTNDVFYPPAPYSSWVISEDTNWIWVAPVEYPSDANDEMDPSLPHKAYEWNEDSENWELLHITIYNSETEEWELQE